VSRKNVAYLARPSTWPRNTVTDAFGNVKIVEAFALT
jgi:hypothetical protein